jgi:hypothetical protein
MKKILKAIPVGIAVALFVFILFEYPPSTSSFYPKCVFKTTTGLACPGCGSFRAAHQLFHGNIVLAFRFNPLLFVLAPLVGFWGLSHIVHKQTGKRINHPFKQRIWLWSLLIAIILFGVLRNLPFYPFNLLLG